MQFNQILEHYDNRHRTLECKINQFPGMYLLVSLTNEYFDDQPLARGVIGFLIVTKYT